MIMETLTSGLLRMSGRGILILCVVFLVRFLLKKLRVSHKYIMGLWAMAFFFFLFPWKISLPFGFWNHTDTAEEVRDAGDGITPGDPWTEGDMDAAVWDADPAEMAWKVPAQIPSKEDRNNGGSQAGQGEAGRFGVKGDSTPEKLGIRDVIEIIWLAGLCLLLGRLLYSYFALKKKLRVSVFYQDNIWWTEETNIPMVFGLIRPQIYLPLFMQKEDPECVIAHENMHIKRKDALFKMLVYIVCVIHWLNPFVWIAYVLFSGDMEKACDEEVIRGMGKEQRKVYAYTLLRMAEESATYRKRIFAAPVCFDEGDVGSRIKNIMKYKKTIRGLGIAAVVVIVGLCALFLTEAKEDGKEDSQESEQIGADESGEGTAPGGSTQKDGAGEGETQNGGTGEEGTQEGGTAGGSLGNVGGQNVVTALPEDYGLSDSRRIEDQSFEVELSGIGKVIFVSYEPDWGTDPSGDVVFALLNSDGTVRQVLEGTCEGNQRAAGETFYSVSAVGFRDVDGDGDEDIVAITDYEYITGSIPEKAEARVYENTGSEFQLRREVSEAATSALVELTIDSVVNFMNLPYNGPVEEGKPENNGQPYGKPVNFDRDGLPADFDKAIENFSYDGTFPDGRQYGFIPEKFSYAVYDVDGDGKDEFILQFSDTITAGMIEEVYAYEDGVFREELAEFPLVTYYDNGAIQAGWSHNQGKAGDRFLWPYNMYRYQPETDSYEFAGAVDGWDREIADSIYGIGQFPDGTDVDGDGFVYFLLPSDWEGHYDNAEIVDRSDYEKWREQFLGGANALEIPYQEVEVETVYPAAQG